MAVMAIAGSLVLLGVRWWLFPVPLFILWLTRGLWVGLVDIALNRVRQMDVVVEENGLGFLAHGERWWLFPDGIRSMEQLTSGVWTICHHNGHLIHIPTSVISAEQVQHIKDAAVRDRAPEDIQAAIDKDRKNEPARHEKTQNGDWKA
jgi:hypothetical protein